MSVEIPRDVAHCVLRVGRHNVKLTNLKKPFWPDLGITKHGLLQYYADISAVLLPHLKNRAMVMKRYPNGWMGDFFFMKRVPKDRPHWLETCPIEHASANVIDFPMVNDLASLLWVVNLGCIDLNQWYSHCADADRPDYMNFDLDPVPGAAFDQVLEASLRVHELLSNWGMKNYVKTTGSRGMHIYVPIERDFRQKAVWAVAKRIALMLAKKHPNLITAEYRVAKRPADRVLVDYNQNSWGRTLASVYSVRPKPLATVSTPVTWDEVEKGFRIEDFRINNVPARVREVGDLFEPLLGKRGRADLNKYL